MFCVFAIVYVDVQHERHIHIGTNEKEVVRGDGGHGAWQAPETGTKTVKKEEKKNAHTQCNSFTRKKQTKNDMLLLTLLVFCKFKSLKIRNKNIVVDVQTAETKKKACESECADTKNKSKEPHRRMTYGFFFFFLHYCNFGRHQTRIGAFRFSVALTVHAVT